MSGSCLHHLVERWADDRPAATAVSADHVTLDFATLDRAANQLAGRLRAAGAGAGQLVAVYGRVCPEVLVAMLAVLKSGAAYLPMDPGDPPARSRAVLGAAGPVLVLATQEWVPSAADLGVPVLALDRGVLTAEADRPRVGCGPADLAYVLFTSGSTGRPKGVLVEHRNVVNYCAWVARANRVGGAVAPLPAVTRFTFDASVQQLLAPLTRGDPVWIVPEEVRTSPERLLATLRGRPGAGLHCVPALWEEVLLLLEEYGTEGLALSSLFLGGEVVRPDLWERTRTLLPGTAMANVYGPTETTVQVTGGFQEPGAPLSAGRPVDGATVLVLDEAHRPLPAERIGEIWLGGAGVARGYLGEPELTAQSFRDGAELGLPPGRLYRSGDAGCLLPDGSLRVLGRLDDQLKVRGFRIEPAEVESVLLGHPGVREAAVVCPAGGPFAGVLCAAVSTVDESGVDLDALRGRAAELLPPHMVPGQWRVLDRLPRTAAGKLDRRRVAGELTTRPRTGRPLSTETEHAVAAVWSEVLGREVTSADDDFFELGGHSLLANRVAARLRRTLGATNALRTLFDRRTVGAVAAALDTGDAPAEPTAPGVEPDRPAPLSLQQEAIWASEAVLSGTPFNHVLLPVLISGPLDVDALAGALSSVLAGQPALRTRFDSDDGGAVTQRVAPAEPVAVPVTDLRGTGRARRDRRVLVEAKRFFAEPIDLGTGPLLRARLLRLGDEEWALLIRTHHIVCDGVSLQVILADLVAAYAGAPGQRARLSYPDFARDQRERLAAGGFDADIAYWRDKLGGPVPALRVAPRPHGDPDPFRFATVSAPLGEAVRARLTGFSRSRGATPFMCLVASLAALLHLRTGVSPVRLGTLTANRETDESHGLVGVFATTLVLQLAVAPSNTYDELVGAARAEVLVSHEHQRVPLELAMSGLAGGGAPFQVGLAWEPVRRAQTVGRTRFEPYVRTGPDTPIPVVASSTDVSVTIAERGSELLGTIEYREAVLDRAEASRLLADLYALLDRQLSEPDRALRELAATEVAGGVA